MGLPELTDEMILRIKQTRDVQLALDEYADALKRWGIQDNNPHRAIAAGKALINEIYKAATAVVLKPQSAEATAVGIKYCCGTAEDLSQEIAKLRNVIQCAAIGQDIKAAWNDVMKDDKFPDIEKPRSIMQVICVNVRCNACDRSLLAVGCTDSRCEEKGAACGLRPLLSAYLHPPAEKKQLSDKDIVDLVRKHFIGQVAQKTLLFTSWKDEIDIDEPTYALKAFVDEVVKGKSE